MENSKSSYVKIINEICTEEGIKLSSYSCDAGHLSGESDQKRAFILGYQFGLNPSSVQQVCNDKNIASEVLKEEDIPSVYHACFRAIGPMLQYTGGKGSWKALLAELEKGTLVCKDNYGTGGNLVFKVRTQAELEKAASDIYKSSEATAVCRYEDIQSEYRLVVLDGEIRLAFQRFVRHLLVMKTTVAKLLAEAIAKGQIHSFLVPNEAELSKLLAKDETYLLNWKHNLGQGASALTLSIPDLEEELVSFVKKTAKALGIRFASIDMIKTETGWKVLEVNAGVMMEHFASFW